MKLVVCAQAGHLLAPKPPGSHGHDQRSSLDCLLNQMEAVPLGFDDVAQVAVLSRMVRKVLDAADLVGYRLDPDEADQRSESRLPPFRTRGVGDAGMEQEEGVVHGLVEKILAAERLAERVVEQQVIVLREARVKVQEDEGGGRISEVGLGQ